MKLNSRIMQLIISLLLFSNVYAEKHLRDVLASCNNFGGMSLWSNISLNTNQSEGSNKVYVSSQHLYLKFNTNNNSLKGYFTAISSNSIEAFHDQPGMPIRFKNSNNYKDPIKVADDMALVIKGELIDDNVLSIHLEDSMLPNIAFKLANSNNAQMFLPVVLEKAISDPSYKVSISLSKLPDNLIFAGCSPLLG